MVFEAQGQDDGMDDSIDDSLDEDEDQDQDDGGDLEDDGEGNGNGDDEGEGDDDLGDEEEDDEDEDDDLVSDGQPDDDDVDLPQSSDDDDDANFKVEDDDDVEPEEQTTPAPKKRGLSLKIKLTSTKEDTPGRDDTDLEDTRPSKSKKSHTKSTPSKNLLQPPQSSQRGRGRPKKVVSYEEDDIDDELESDSENVIPTPALDDELLLTDEETEYTPDITKMTERQRAKLENDNLDEDKTENDKFLSLSNKVSKRRILTEEENQLRKAEIARKRKNLTERKLEEEKQDTINKLLKRRAGKASAAQLKEDEEVNNIKDKPRRPQIQHEALFSWVSKRDGLQLRVPGPLINEVKAANK
ncbi:Midasin [Wickerhamomyces ciferrii]|uniref:Midasin n=1 Tax=Wickerhamomyces ciferrii (strain ATCC 14091 / BCRC 22168 / CBS 111 / JCM 3599 / NBRC 0793 / NRRL Y-1031 F-60-10) TaxID=1206466 RepID=K0KA76_WICCF|nr:Midasin [Wickerhamomyces ciferrii]CCH41835.1 Midasin [Wickerhamomyces ciferrii]